MINCKYFVFEFVGICILIWKCREMRQEFGILWRHLEFKNMKSFWQLFYFERHSNFIRKVTPEISSKGRYSISNINEQLTICYFFLNLVHQSLSFLLCCVKTWCYYSVLFSFNLADLIGPWSLLPALDICDLYILYFITIGINLGR